MSASLDISANRSTSKYTPREQFLRVLWGFAKLLFRFSPRPCFGCRRFILRCFGATVGKNVNIYPSVVIYFPWNLKIGDWSAIGEDALIYNLGPITIGQSVTISHRAHLCAGTHDYTRADMPLLKPPITIHDQAWICANALVGPNVTIGQGAIVGAGAVVMKNVEPWTIVAGNPAVKVKDRVISEKTP
ncbi:MAG: putative colanic acid biosynthesis acetyltransferase [Verrucomicrobiota bacterium]